MKRIKILFAIIIAITITSCSCEDYQEIITVENYNIIYDSQDNIVRINNGEWLSSLDWETYIDNYNWEPANDEFGIRHFWDDKAILIKSNNYEIYGFDLDGLYDSYEIINGDLIIYFEDMQNYMINTDWYYFNIKVKVNEQ